MNPRHLWDASLIEDGNDIVIWELFFDIWSFYKNRHRKSISREKSLKQEQKSFENVSFTGNDNKRVLPKENDYEFNTKYDENCIKLSRDKLFNQYTDFNKYKKAVRSQSKINDSKNNRTISESPERK